VPLLLIAGLPLTTASVSPSAPWWANPILAGIFVLGGALTAFVSTWFSDRRRLRREDLRQWDKEIREGYVRVSRSVEVIADTFYSYFPDPPHSLFQEAYRVAQPSVNEIRDVHANFTIIAQQRTIERLKDIDELAQTILATLHDGIRPKKAIYLELRDAATNFLVAVKANLRIENIEPTRKRRRLSSWLQRWL
jgi:hypothetical protein